MAVLGDRKKLIEQARAREQLEINNARRCPVKFIEFCFRDELTDKKITPQWFHEEWQQLLTMEKYVVIHAPVEHGKTIQVAVGRTLYEIGKNPGVRGCIISETASQAQKIMGAIKKHIESNPRVRKVFPHLRPGDIWRHDAITVERDTIAKDYTLFCSGISSVPNSARLDFAILDDCLNYENTRTEEQRQKSLSIIEVTVIQRLTTNGRFWAIGTPWHNEDAYHELAKRKTFTYRKYSAVENPDDSPERWRPIWPDNWPVKRLLERQESAGKNNFKRKLLCKIVKNDNARFDVYHIAHAKSLGKNLTLLRTRPNDVNRVPMRCYTGVDIGAGKKGALSVIFTIGIDAYGRYQVLEIESGKWKSPIFIQKLLSTQKRFGSVVATESNATQVFIQEQAEYKAQAHDMGFAFVKHYTGRNKNDPAYGVESLALDFAKGVWVIPSKENSSEINAWISEIEEYEPGLHTGDRLMASWIAREASRKHKSNRAHIDTLSR